MAHGVRADELGFNSKPQHLPLLFTAESLADGFKELYALGMTVAVRTWREMEAAEGDFDSVGEPGGAHANRRPTHCTAQVIRAVRKQIEVVLKKPIIEVASTVESMRAELALVSYAALKRSELETSLTEQNLQLKCGSFGVW